MRKIIIKISSIAASAATLFGICGCNNFLDVVPNDGVATVEMSFNMRSSALHYLATCYSYMPNDGLSGSDPAVFGGDELWDLVGRATSLYQNRVPNTMFQIARGNMSSSSVYANDWVEMYQGIRCCDVLCDNIDRVPDMREFEKTQWKAEVTFLKAYFHFNLIRKWGPIPIVRKSLPIDSSIDEVRVSRSNIDECFDFVIELLDQAMPNLRPNLDSEDEMGRITRPICAAFKARVCTYAASPLFNGNSQFKSLTNNDGELLFPQKTDDEKRERWIAAMKACEQAIIMCEEAGYKLYDGSAVTDGYKNLTDSLKLDLTIRGSISQRWNSEIIWGNTQSSASQQATFQKLVMPNLHPEYAQMLGGYRFMGAPIKIAEQFYTRNGLPIMNDNEWNGVNPLGLTEPEPDHAYYLKKNYTTINLNVNREPRFYASLGFDGGRWFDYVAPTDKSIQPTDIPAVECRFNGPLGKGGTEVGPLTGYFPKKLFPFQCIFYAAEKFTSYWFPWPIIRLSDLYLLYAECINEAEGPKGEHSDALFKYLDAVRERAGIPDVKTSWDVYSNRKDDQYYNTQFGMREIIRAERLNEFVFEGQRFWDIRRWMTAPTEYTKGIYGFNVMAQEPEDYYVRTFIEEQKFGQKDYFWPIPMYYIERNPNLVQNLGW